jgi:carbon monoxide dehydrogenase subunit G
VEALEDGPWRSTNAPATAEGELRIDADPSTVFSVIAAIDQWPSWNPDVKSVTVEGPVQPGMAFRWKAGPVRAPSL